MPSIQMTNMNIRMSKLQNQRATPVKFDRIKSDEVQQQILINGIYLIKLYKKIGIKNYPFI